MEHATGLKDMSEPQQSRGSKPHQAVQHGSSAPEPLDLNPEPADKPAHNIDELRSQPGRSGRLLLHSLRGVAQLHYRRLHCTSLGLASRHRPLPGALLGSFPPVPLWDRSWDLAVCAWPPLQHISHASVKARGRGRSKTNSNKQANQTPALSCYTRLQAFCAHAALL